VTNCSVEHADGSESSETGSDGEILLKSRKGVHEWSVWVSVRISQCVMSSRLRNLSLTMKATGRKMVYERPDASKCFSIYADFDLD